MILRGADKPTSLVSPVIGHLYKLAFRGTLHDGKSRSTKVWRRPKRKCSNVKTNPILVTRNFSRTWSSNCGSFIVVLLSWKLRWARYRASPNEQTSIPSRGTDSNYVLDGMHSSLAGIRHRAVCWTGEYLGCRLYASCGSHRLGTIEPRLSLLPW